MDPDEGLRRFRVAQRSFAAEEVAIRTEAYATASSRRVTGLVQQSNAVHRGQRPERENVQIVHRFYNVAPPPLIFTRSDVVPRVRDRAMPIMTHHSAFNTDDIYEGFTNTDQHAEIGFHEGVASKYRARPDTGVAQSVAPSKFELPPEDQPPANAEKQVQDSEKAADANYSRIFADLSADASLLAPNAEDPFGSSAEAGTVAELPSNAAASPASPGASFASPGPSNAAFASPGAAAAPSPAAPSPGPGAATPAQPIHPALAAPSPGPGAATPAQPSPPAPSSPDLQRSLPSAIAMFGTPLQTIQTPDGQAAAVPHGAPQVAETQRRFQEAQENVQRALANVNGYLRRGFSPPAQSPLNDDSFATAKSASPEGQQVAQRPQFGNDATGLAAVAEGAAEGQAQQQLSFDGANVSLTSTQPTPRNLGTPLSLQGSPPIGPPRPPVAPSPQIDRGPYANLVNQQLLENDDKLPPPSNENAPLPGMVPPPEPEEEMGEREAIFNELEQTIDPDTGYPYSFMTSAAAEIRILRIMLEHARRNGDRVPYAVLAPAPVGSPSVSRPAAAPSAPPLSARPKTPASASKNMYKVRNFLESPAVAAAPAPAAAAAASPAAAAAPAAPRVPLLNAPSETGVGEEQPEETGGTKIPLGIFLDPPDNRKLFLYQDGTIRPSKRDGSAPIPIDGLKGLRVGYASGNEPAKGNARVVKGNDGLFMFLKNRRDVLQQAPTSDGRQMRDLFFNLLRSYHKKGVQGYVSSAVDVSPPQAPRPSGSGKPTKRGRFPKGSDEAKAFMAELRAKRKKV